MKLLFITPPMGNWAPWGDRHLAVNSLHSQVAAFVQEKKAADVEVLDCRALDLDDDQMLDEVRRRRPDVVFFGSMIPAAGGAAQLNRFHDAMKRIKEVAPDIATVGGGLMYTAVPQQIMAENPSSISPLSEFLAIMNTLSANCWQNSKNRRPISARSEASLIAKAKKSFSIRRGH